MQASEQLNRYLISVSDLEEIKHSSSFVSKVADAKFENIYLIKSVNQYIEIINSLLLSSYNQRNENIVQRQYIFRGFSDINQMQAKLFSKKLEEKEFDLISKFEERGCLKTGQFNNAIDLVATAEHYGVYTRLLDWSHSPLVATLFALFQEHPNEKNFSAIAFRNYRESVVLKNLLDGDNNKSFSETKQPLTVSYRNMVKYFLLLLKTCNSISESIRIEYNKKTNVDWYRQVVDCRNRSLEISKLYEIYEYFSKIEQITSGIKSDKEAMKNTKKFILPNSKIFIETNFSNERLHNQKGLFELVGGEKYNNDYGNKKTSVLLIPNLIKKDLLFHIKTLGVDYYSLMDDAENFSKYINHEVMCNLSYGEEGIS